MRSPAPPEGNRVHSVLVHHQYQYRFCFLGACAPLSVQCRPPLVTCWSQQKCCDGSRWTKLTGRRPRPTWRVSSCWSGGEDAKISVGRYCCQTLEGILAHSSIQRLHRMLPHRILEQCLRPLHLRLLRLPPARPPARSTPMLLPLAEASHHASQHKLDGRYDPHDNW